MKKIKEYISKEILVIILIVGVFILGGLSILRERFIRVDRDLLVVRAEGKATARPDLANISFGVKTETEKEASVAIQKGSHQMNQIINSLKKWGIEDRDIKTVSYNLITIYEYPQDSGKEVLSGYQLNQNIRVKVRDITKVGEVIREANTAGANQIGGISFTIDDKEALKKIALDNGIKNGKIKAKEISKATGIRLGKMVNLYEYENSASPYNSSCDYAGMGGMYKSESVTPEIEGGEIEINLMVDLTYEVK